MPDDSDFQRFLPEDQQPDRLSVDIPPESSPLRPDRVPTGYEPMGEIQLRGRLFRRLATGQVDWWLLITGWLLMGGLALLLAFLAVTSSAWTAWMIFGVSLLPLLVLARGTAAKLTHRRSRRRR